MSFEKIEGYIPTGKEFIKMSKSSQSFWLKFVLSGSFVFEDVMKLRQQMNPGTQEDLENWNKK